MAIAAKPADTEIIRRSEPVKKLIGRIGAGAEAEASGYPNEALTGWWVPAAGFEPVWFGSPGT